MTMLRKVALMMATIWVIAGCGGSATDTTITTDDPPPDGRTGPSAQAAKIEKTADTPGPRQ